MKKTLIALTIMIASVANAREITKAELMEIYQDNEVSHFTITPGMTAEYQNAEIRYNYGKPFTCLVSLTEVVMESVPSIKYLVYSKKTYLNECGQTPAGKIWESLEWRRVRPIEWKDTFGTVLTRVSINENIALVKGNSTSMRGTSYWSVKTDVTQSQFYFVNEEKNSEGDIRLLLKRSLSDTRLINTDDLDVEELSRY